MDKCVYAMRFLIFILFVLLLGCDNSTNQKNSFWESQKRHFRYQNKEEFVSDSILRFEFDEMKFKKIEHPIFDSILGNPVYLYSWQNRDSTLTEFTVIKNDDEHGLKILYFILDKKDNLLSSTQIAGKGTEDAFWFETRSKFIHHDTLLNIGAITQWYDYDKRQPITTFKGDTTFSYLILNKNGKVTAEIFKEVRALNFENSFDN